MVEERSDEQINGSIVDNLRKSVALQNYDIPDDQDLFQSDKNCAICDASFGKIGIGNAKKHLCKFCMRGVCAKCSPEKIQHPITKKEEKICSSCIEKLMETHLSQDFHGKIFEARSEKENLAELLDYKIKETQIEISYNQYTEQTIESETKVNTVKIQDLKNAQKELLDSQEETRMKHARLHSEYKEYDAEMKKKDSIIDTLNNNLRILKETYDSNKELLPSLRNNLGELQDIEFKLKNQTKEKKTIARSLTLTDKEQKLSEELDEIKHKIRVIGEEKIFFMNEIEKISEENSAMNEKLLAEGVGTRHKSVDSLIIASNQNFSFEEEAKVKALRDRQQENIKTLKDLRMKLEANNIFIKKSVLNTDPAPDPGSRPCARCLIF